MVLDKTKNILKEISSQIRVLIIVLSLVLIL